MKSKKALQILFCSVIAVAIPGVSFAQQQVDTGGGRMLESNNQIGSNGLNQGGYNRANQVTGQDIVSGNVTAGKEFHWGVSTSRGVDNRTPSYADPTAFRGQTGMYQTDRFIQRSSGGSDARLNALTGNIATPNYADYRAAPAPAGYVQNPETGSYIPAPPPQRAAEDTRLGMPSNIPGSTLPKPGELLMPGPVDPTNNDPTLFTGSPLYGIRQFKLNDASDQYFLSNYTNLRRPGANDRLQVDDNSIKQMQQEVNDTLLPQDNQSGDQSGAQNNPANLANSNAVASAAVANGSFSDKPLNSQLTSTAIGSSINTDQSSRNTIAAAAQQSTQYSELRARMSKFQAEKRQTDEEAQREFQAKLKAKQDATAAKTPGDASGVATGSGQTPGTEGSAESTTQPAGNLENAGMTDYGKQSREIMEKGLADSASKGSVSPLAGSARPSEKLKHPEPLKIASLAEGVRAKGLHDVLIAAEEQMKQGKFAAALDQYEIAEQVSPNNAMITLGKANAELGASYYGRAETDLRKAFMSDPSLLLAQYDLKTMLGEERLQFLIKDLKEIASKEKQAVRPVFLLAYIAYNSGNGNERRAATFLTAADKRAGGRDSMIRLMQANWSLPTAEGDTTEGIEGGQ